MKGYVKLRRGLLDHFKVMSASEIKVYTGTLLLANVKNAMVKVTLAELADIIKLIERLPKTIKKVYISGGEPFVRKDIIDICKNFLKREI